MKAGVSPTPETKQRSRKASQKRRSESAKTPSTTPSPSFPNKPQGKKKQSFSHDLDLEKKILTLIKSEPVDATSIANRLQLSPSRRKLLKDLLFSLEKEGRIARIRRDRYILPKEADLFTGEIQFHTSGTAHILSPEKGGTDVFVSPENTATALHGDKVVARIFPERSQERDGRFTNTRSSGRKEGRVIRILERKNDRIVGTLQRSKNFFYVVADDPRFVHNLYVPEPRPPLIAVVGDKVVAQLESWQSRHINPEGKVIEVLGKAGAPGVDMISIIRKHRLPEEFPEKVRRAAETVGAKSPSSEAENREDCRGDFVFTIDPDDAKDFDDAICVEKTARGWTLSVHIADVSHYVQPKAVLDLEAYERGNSVYLPDRVIPMLPEVLSNGLCSLRPDEDRLAFAVFAEISSDGVVRRTRFAKTIIRSKKRLTYKQAFAILQKPATNELEERVHEAWALSSRLRKRRFEQGSLDLDFPETKVWVDAEGKPTHIEKVENDISHQLIEEMMLLANESVAKEMRRKKQPTIYRVHESPDPARLLEYREMAMSLGAKCGDLTNREELQHLLNSVRGLPMEFSVKLGLLKSLKRARYSEEPLGHYGLSKSDYLHFTSPIRRYADLVAHRALERLLGITKQGPDSKVLPAMAEHISTTERVASDAEKEAVKLKKLEYFQSQTEGNQGKIFKARVLEVRNYGMFIELPDYLISGLIHVSTLEGDFFVFDPIKGRFFGRKTKQVFEVGIELEVVVSRVDLFKQQIDFRLPPSKK